MKRFPRKNLIQWRLFAALAIALMVIACGQKGPLYQPGNPPAHHHDKAGG